MFRGLLNRLQFAAGGAVERAKDAVGADPTVFDMHVTDPETAAKIDQSLTELGGTLTDAFGPKTPEEKAQYLEWYRGYYGRECPYDP